MSARTAPATAPAGTAPATAPAGKAPATVRTVRLVMGDKQALAILFPQKGHAEKVERLFDAVAPMLSTWLATGGNKTDFQDTATARHGALVSALWAAHATGKGTAKKIGNAWACIAARALTMAGKSCATDQAAHDEAIAELCYEFCAFFPAPAVKEKAEDYESPTAKIKRLESECAALRLECDALKAAMVRNAPADAPALV